MSYYLTERCKKLRDDAVNVKSANSKICAQRSLLFDEGTYEYFKNGGKSNHEIIAAGLANVISNAKPYIQEGELIVGYNYADGEVPERWIGRDCVKDREILKENGFTEEKINSYFKHMNEAMKGYSYAPDPQLDKKDIELDMEMASIGRCIADNHTVIGYEEVLKSGFSGLLTITEYWESVNGSSELYSAMKTVCRAACKLGKNYADLAAELRNAPGTDEKRKAELKMIEDTCRNVPENPAKTFREAVQSLLFAHIINTWEDYINANSIGRLDQILYPYYEKDIAEGIITKDEAFELICCLWIKLYRDYDVQQSCVGGCLKDGSSAVNELSYMMLDATEMLDFVRCLSVRFSPSEDRKFIRRALEVVGRVKKGIPFFFNDDIMIPALVSKGIALEDARNYTQIGCVETVIPGKSNPHAVSGETNLLKAMEYVLGNGRSLYNSELFPGLATGEIGSFTEFEQFEKAVLKQIDNILDSSCGKVSLWTKTAETNAVKPYKSLLTKGCAETNRDFNNHGAVYDYYQIMLGGVPNLADSLAVIKKFVFDDKKYTLGYFLEQLENDFPNELFRLECINKAPKYGNDDDSVDLIAAKIIDYSCEVLDELSKKYSMSFHAQPFTFLWMVDHGRVSAASPDGRKKGEIIAYSMSPMQGRDFNGFTALLNSIAKMPAQKYPGTTSAIVEADPKLFEEENIGRMADILAAAAGKGLCNVQYNCIDADTLRDARSHPEKYRNLAVRVSGFSQKFNLLTPELQDHIIGRTKHSCL